MEKRLETETRPRALVACVLGAWIATAAGTSPAMAQGQDLSDIARKSVLRLKVQRETRPGGANGVDEKELAVGSAVIVSSETVGETKVLLLATAYHVLIRAKEVSVYTHAGENPIATLGADARCYVDRSRELAFLEVVLQAGEGADLAAIDLARTTPAPDLASDPREKMTGMAFGYARFRSVPIDSCRVDILGVLEAKTLGIVRDGPFSRGKGDQQPDAMRFRLLGDQATLDGMSGGLALDGEGRFTGLIYGRRTDQFNLVIPANLVLEALERVKDRGSPRSTTLGAHPFREASLYMGGGDPEVTVENRIDWGTLDGLNVLLGDDPLGSIDRFQEIVVNPPLRSTPRNLEIWVHATETLPNPDHKIEIWVDGEPALIHARTHKVTVPMQGHPGETMITIIKESGKVNDFELGKFLLPSRVDVSFQYEGEEPFLHLVRSLPVIAQRYPLFVTIANDPDDLGEAKPGERPANARLALRLDYAEAILNQAPFSLEVKKETNLNPPGSPRPQDRKEAEPDTSIDGLYRLDPQEAWKLQRVSDQRLGLKLNGRAIFNNDSVRFRDVVLKLNPERKDKEPPQFLVGGRFQFPYRMPDRGVAGDSLILALSARATGSSGTGSVRLDIRDGLQVDVAGLLHHLLASFVNSSLIGNEQLHPIPDEKIAPFLERLGFASIQGWKPHIHRAAFILDPATQKEWLILTFRLDPKDTRAVQGGNPPAARDLLAPPSLAEAPGRVIALEAWGVPGSLAARFPGMEVANPMTDALKGAVAQELSLTLDLDPDPKRWFAGLEAGEEIFFFRNNAEDIADRILKALAHSVEKSEAVKLRVVLDSGFLRDVLGNVLGRPDLKLGIGENKARVEVVARREDGASRVDLALLDGPLVLETPEAGEVDLGKGTVIRGGRLEVAKLTASGVFESSEVKADIDGSLVVKEVRSGGNRYEDASGRVLLSLHSKAGQDELATGSVVDADLTGPFLGLRAKYKIRGKLPFKIDRAMNVDIDPKSLIGK